MKAILQRVGEHPLRSVVWYLFEKPFLLWDWSIRIGQGDIYVYPTANTPLQTNVLLRIWLSVCRGLNLPLSALGSFFFMGGLAMPERASRAAAVAAACLLTFVTLMYSALQAEPTLLHSFSNI